jgi:hypothetical protein
MSRSVPDFALVGRSFPSEAFDGLYQASLTARQARRGRADAWDASLRGPREWRGSGEPITLPMRLPA